MDIKTEQYQLAYGRKPRGRGSWAFEFFCRPIDAKTYSTPMEWSEPEFVPGGSCTYSEAKGWADRRRRELNASKIRVST